MSAMGQKRTGRGDAINRPEKVMTASAFAEAAIMSRT